MLSAEAEAAYYCPVSGDILAGEIVKQFPATTNQPEQSDASMGIFVMLPEVVGQLADALGKDGDLDFCRTCIGGMCSVFPDNFRLGVLFH